MRINKIYNNFGLFLLVCLLSLIYFSHYDDIGKLPAESIEFSATNSAIHKLEQDLDTTNGCQQVTLALNLYPKVKNGNQVEVLGPSILLNKIDKNLLELIDNSVFLVNDGRLYAADEIGLPRPDFFTAQELFQDQIPREYLSKINDRSPLIEKIKTNTAELTSRLIEQGYVNKSSIIELHKRTKEYYSRCPRLSKDKELSITEYFWANEGRSALHHWAHFYEGGVLGPSLKAQYGVILPILINQISTFLPNDGPDQYISIAWILFYLSALVYCFLLYFIFKKYPIFVTIALLVKIICFINLTEFVIFLAPGAHWFRELNFLIIYFISNYFIFESKKHQYHYFIFFPLFIFTFLFDPMSGFFGWISVLCSYILYIYKEKNFVISLNKILILIGIIITVLTAIFMYSSNAFYLIWMLKENFFGDQLDDRKVRYLVINGLLLIFIAFTYIYKNLNYKYIYFSFLGNISILYYLMTPDWVHYYKYLEYAIVFYMCIIIVIYNKLCIYLQTNHKKNNYIYFIYQNIKYIKAILLTIVLSVIIINLSMFSKINTISPITQFYSSNGNLFFEPNIFVINNKKIVSNMSEELASHLASYKFDKENFIVSNFDKYLLFLYNVKNNFGSIDLRGQMVNKKEMDNIISFINRNGGTYVIDQKNFEIQLFHGAKISGDQRLIIGNGNYYLGPYNYLNSKLRIAKISQYIIDHCHKNETQSNNNWLVYICTPYAQDLKK